MLRKPTYQSVKGVKGGISKVVNKKGNFRYGVSVSLFPKTIETLRVIQRQLGLKSVPATVTYLANNYKEVSDE